jgi:predicted transcriptional regulator
MNDNTILRIKVPAHLYESVKEQLSLTEAKKQNYGAGFSVVKEKKMKTPKDGMTKMEEANTEIKQENTEMEKKTHSLEELKKAKKALDKKIQAMESVNENFNEAKDMPYHEIVDKAIKDALKYGNTDQSKLDILINLKDSVAKKIKEMSSGNKVEENINEGTDAEFAANNLMHSIAKGDPFTIGVSLVLGVAGAVLAGANAGAIKNTLVGWWKGLKDEKAKEAIKDFADQNNVKLG